MPRTRKVTSGTTTSAPKPRRKPSTATTTGCQLPHTAADPLQCRVGGTDSQLETRVDMPSPSLPAPSQTSNGHARICMSYPGTVKVRSMTCAPRLPHASTSLSRVSHVQALQRCDDDSSDDARPTPMMLEALPKRCIADYLRRDGDARRICQRFPIVMPVICRSRTGRGNPYHHTHPCHVSPQKACCRSYSVCKLTRPVDELFVSRNDVA